MIRIRQIDHLVLRVSDLKAMMDFYINVIGCTVEKIQAQIGLYQVRAGSSLIDLIPIDGKLGKIGGAAPGNEGRNLDHFCLRVDPFDAGEIIRHLQAHNGEPGEVESRYGAEGEGPSIYVTDPEGNVLELKGAPWPSTET
jgi:glyoxylase I family protein